MLLIIDLEHTCMPEAEQPADYHGQIIEIGAAWVTPPGVVIDTFEIFVQAENPVTAFCTELTGITQENVDSGLPFPDAMQALAAFAAKHSGEIWASWGAGDLKCLLLDCEHHGVHHGVENPLKDWVHRNLKKEWCRANRAMLKEKVGQGRKVKQVGMSTALAVSGIFLEGTHHRALSDVLNIAKLLPGCAEPESDFQRILREKGESQKRHIEAIRAMTPEQRETAMEELKNNLRGDGVPPRKKMEAPEFSKPESDFQRLVREKKESQKEQIEALRNATPEQREIALEALKNAMRGDGVKPLPKMPRPKYNFDY